MINPQLQSEILRLHHAEKWPVGTIARQLGVHHSTVRRVIDADGRPRHEGDIRAQSTLAMDNLEAVLGKAGMSLSNVVRLTIYTTEIDEVFKSFDKITSRLDAAGVKPAQTLLGVARLALPQFKIEIEATAAA